MVPWLSLLSLTAVPAAPFQPALVALTLDRTTVAPGGSVEARFTWLDAGDQTADADYRVFVHLRRADQTEDDPKALRGGADHEPSPPTSRWRSGRKVTYAVTLPIPADFTPGDYVVLVGLYDPYGGPRLALNLPPYGTDRRYLAAHLTVVAPGQAPAAQPWHAEWPVPAGSAQSTEAHPAPPVESVEVGAGPLRAVVDKGQPRLVTWRLPDGELPGDTDGEGVVVRVMTAGEEHPRNAASAALPLTWTFTGDAHGATWHGRVEHDGKAAVAFDLRLDTREQEAAVTLQAVTESGEWQLVDVYLPRLLAAAGDDAALALPFNAGRLVRAAVAGPSERSLHLDWFTERLCGVVSAGRMGGYVDVPGADDGLVAAVVDARRVALGAELAWRAPAHPPVPSLRLGAAPSVRIKLVSTPQPARWTDGAALLRDEVTARPPALYDDALLYKIFCDTPGARRFTTFDEALAFARRVGRWTGGVKQVVYLVGWQHHGHDTGYPDVFTANERLGGADTLRRVLRAAPADGILMSFHDNYDDAYRDSPAWNPDLIARDASGGLCKGGVWAGGQSYINSFSDAARPAALARVDRTLDMWPVGASYHIDVLSAVPCRVDYSAVHPASAEASLANKRAIVAEFNRLGRDVTSEGFVAPFVGVLGHAWNMNRGAQVLFAGEERIPFTPFVYHGRATWGGANWAPDAVPEALLYGCTFSADFTKDTPRQAVLDAHFLLNVPFQALRRRAMTDFRVEAGVRRSEFGPGAFVEVDAAGHYRVVVDGRQVSADGATLTASPDGHGQLAYRRNSGSFDWPAPEGWRDGAAIEARPLLDDGPGEAVPGRVDGGRLRFEARGGVAYRLTAP